MAWLQMSIPCGLQAGAARAANRLAGFGRNAIDIDWISACSVKPVAPLLALCAYLSKIRL